MAARLLQSGERIAGLDNNFLADRVHTVFRFDHAMHCGLISGAIGFEVRAKRLEKYAVLRIALRAASLSPNVQE